MRSLYNQLRQQSGSLADSLDRITNEALVLWQGQHLRTFTAHGESHILQVEANLDALTRALQISPQKLQPQEMYVLIAACYLHDIGMQLGERDAREKHAQYAFDLILRSHARNNNEERRVTLPIDDRNAREAIAATARGHWTNFAVELVREDVLVGMSRGRLRLLGLLLAVADLLDLSPVRATYFRSIHQLDKLDATAELHQTMHELVKGFQIVAPDANIPEQLQYVLEWSDDSVMTHTISDWIFHWFDSQWQILKPLLHQDSGGRIRWEDPWKRVTFRKPVGPIPHLSENALKFLRAERASQMQSNNGAPVQMAKARANTTLQPVLTTDVARILGFEPPTDYQPRVAVETPVTQWCAASGKLSTFHYVWGPSGAGKTTTLGWLFRAAFKGEFTDGVVVVWLQLTQVRHPLEAAKAIVESLARVSPEDPVIAQARELVREAEQQLLQEPPLSVVVAHSAQLVTAGLARRVESTPSESEQLYGAAVAGKDTRSEGGRRGLPKSSEMLQVVPAGDWAVMPQYDPQEGPETTAIMTYAARQQVTIHPYSSAPVVLARLARHLAVTLGGSGRRAWLIFIDTWDWAQTGHSRGTQPKPEITISWLADLFLPAIRLQGVDLFVLAGGQMPADEITSKFTECGFKTMTTDFDAFDAEEFRQFISGKGIRDEQCAKTFEHLTGRNPQLIRFWFEMAKPGEAPEEQLKAETEEAPAQGPDWLWRRIRERMPDPLPTMLQVAAVLPAFDRTILESATGLVLNDEAWTRLKGYSLVEPLQSDRVKLLHIKEVFARLLRSTATPDFVQRTCLHAVSRFLLLTDHRIHDFDPDEMEREKELSLLLMRAALEEKSDYGLAWVVFLREAARWIDPVDHSVWAELRSLVVPCLENPIRRASFTAVRQAWEDLAREPARRSKRLLGGLRALASADHVPLETRLVLLRVGLILSTTLHDWQCRDGFLAITRELGLDGHEEFSDVRCKMHLAAGDVASATAILDSASPETMSPRTLARLGEFANKVLHDRNRAILLYRKSVEAAVDDGGESETLVNLLARAGQVEQAIEIALKTAKRFPNDSLSAGAVGVAYTKLRPKDWPKAAEWHEKAVRLQPNSEEICSNLAVALREAKGVVEARQRLEALAREFPDSAWLADSTARSFGGNEPKNWSKAAEWHEKAVRLQPKAERVVSGLAIALGQATGVVEARQRLEALAREFPDSAWLATVTGRSFAGDEPKDWSKAAEWFEKAVRLQPNSEEICSDLAVALREAKGVVEARQRLEALAREFPDSAWLATVTGRSFAGDEPKDWSKAAEWHEKAVRLQPKAERVVSGLAIALGQATGVVEARQRLEALAREFPDSAWLATVTGRSFAGDEPKDWSKAAEWHEKAVRLQPNSEEICSNLAVALREAKGVVEARQRLEALAREFSESATNFVSEIMDLVKKEHPAESLRVADAVPAEQWIRQMHVTAAWCCFRLHYEERMSKHLDVILVDMDKQSSPGDVQEAAEIALGCGKPVQALEVLASFGQSGGEDRWPAIDALISAGVHALNQSSADLKQSLAKLLSQQSLCDRWDCTELMLVARALPEGPAKTAFSLGIQFYEKELSCEELNKAIAAL